MSVQQVLHIIIMWIRK